MALILGSHDAIPLSNGAAERPVRSRSTVALVLAGNHWSKSATRRIDLCRIRVTNDRDELLPLRVDLDIGIDCIILLVRWPTVGRNRRAGAAPMRWAVPKRAYSPSRQKRARFFAVTK